MTISIKAVAGVEIAESGLLLVESSPGIFIPATSFQTPTAVSASTANPGEGFSANALSDDVFYLVAAENLVTGNLVRVVSGGRVGKMSSGGVFIGRVLIDASTGFRVPVSVSLEGGGGGDEILLWIPNILDVDEDQEAVITVTGSGTVFAWKRSTDNGGTWLSAPGVNNLSSYTIASASYLLDDGDQYRCEVDGVLTNICQLKVFSPLKLSPFVWFNETSARFQERDGSGTTVAGDGQPIGDLRDISGNNRHFRAPTDAARPLNQVAQVNGRAVIEYGGSHVLRGQVVGDWTFLHNGSTYTIAAVFKPGIVADPNASNCLCATRNSGATPGMFFAHDTRDGISDRRLACGIAIPAGPITSCSTSEGSVPANLHCIAIVQNDPDNEILPARSIIWHNGNEAATYNSVSGTPVTSASVNALNLGAGVDASQVNSSFLTGDICEFIIVNGAISDTNRLRLRDWLAHRWNIALAPRAEVGLFCDGVMHRNMSSSLIVSYNSPTENPSNPIYDNAPLDPGVDIVYPSVYWDGTQFICVYTSFNADGSFAYDCRITSPDGIAWTATSLGLVDVGGNTNNCVFMTEQGGIFVYPKQTGGVWVASMENRIGSPEGVKVYTSADGLTWALVKDLASVTNAAYSEARHMTQFDDGRWACSYAYGHSTQDREIGICLSATNDLAGTWVDQGSIIKTSVNTDQKYGIAFERHGRGWLATVLTYDQVTELMDGDLYWLPNLASPIKLIDAAFKRGPGGSWNDEIVSPTSILTRGESTAVWGNCSSEDHAGPFPRGAMLALWTWRKRRWAQCAGSGTVESLAFSANAAELTVNANAVGGSIQVEVIDDATGQVMIGYSISESAVITTDGVDLAVMWGANALPVDRRIRLRFILRNAILYSWTAGTE